MASTAGGDVSLATIRQRKMVAALEQQILLVRAQVEGTEYTATTRAWATNDMTGARERIQRAKRIKSWYWQAENNRWHLAVRYGSRVLELVRGKNAIEVAELADLVPLLVTLRAATRAGELDEAINTACVAMRTARVGAGA